MNHSNMLRRGKSPLSKIISLVITSVLMLGVLSAYASPEERKPDPVDLSVLSEEEFGKIPPSLLNELKTANKDDWFLVNISLCEIIPSSELRDTALSRVKPLEKELRAETRALIRTYNSDSSTAEEKEAALERLQELKRIRLSDKIKYRMSLGKVLDETNGKELREFIKDHNINVTEDTFTLELTMDIFLVKMNATQILEILNDTKVASVELSSFHSDKPTLSRAI